MQDKGQSKPYIHPLALENITAFCLHVSSAKLYWQFVTGTVCCVLQEVCVRVYKERSLLYLLYWQLQQVVLSTAVSGFSGFSQLWTSTVRLTPYLKPIKTYLKLEPSPAFPPLGCQKEWLFPYLTPDKREIRYYSLLLDKVSCTRGASLAYASVLLHGHGLVLYTYTLHTWIKSNR